MTKEACKQFQFKWFLESTCYQKKQQVQSKKAWERLVITNHTRPRKLRFRLTTEFDVVSSFSLYTPVICSEDGKISDSIDYIEWNKREVSVGGGFPFCTEWTPERNWKDQSAKIADQKLTSIFSQLWRQRTESNFKLKKLIAVWWIMWESTRLWCIKGLKVPTRERACCRAVGPCWSGK